MGSLPIFYLPVDLINSLNAPLAAKLKTSKAKKQRDLSTWTQEAWTPNQKYSIESGDKCKKSTGSLELVPAMHI